MDITKPSITKLSRRAGVKSLSDDCHDMIRNIMENKLTDVIKAVIAVNSEHNTKTIMSNDVYDALSLLNHRVTQSNDLNV
jgi:histone H3/H4